MWPLREPPRPIRERLPGAATPAQAVLALRGDRRPFALAGDWMGGEAVLGSHPVWTATGAEDPFALLDRGPRVGAGGAAVGGGWAGWLGFGLARTLEPVPPPPPRPVALPPFALAFHDHVVRRDADGAWWFEALWTAPRAAALARRLEQWRARLAAPPVAPQAVDAGPLRVAAPGAAGHLDAVAECRERIAAGEVFQANLCLRLEGPWRAGDPLDLFARGIEALAPRHAAFVAGPWGAVASLSPELFLRRRGREVVTEPIKGTGADPEALARSAKDRAENVMIADLMRNDLGRVCAFGTVRADALAEPRPGPGVWHLVSTVRGELRPDATDGALLRAAFPPGSCVGAPKVQALRVVHELEGTGREAYTGAIGLRSPLGGLELNVAIRSFEVARGRVWLGAGGGVVHDSAPEGELAEALAKAAPLAAAAGLAVEAPARGRGTRAPRALRDGRDRPDPARGLLETLLVRDGVPVAADAHLARLTGSARALGTAPPPGDLRARLAAAARGIAHGRARVVLAPDGGTEVAAQGEAPRTGVVRLVPFVLPGGLGAHKWADRRLVDALAAACGATPLLLDADGAVLEAGHASVVAVRGGERRTPPADGRILPGTTRARLLAEGALVEAELALDDLRAADAVELLSAVRGVHPGCIGHTP